jgi:hypothetical protein
MNVWLNDLKCGLECFAECFLNGAGCVDSVFKTKKKRRRRPVTKTKGRVKEKKNI